MKWVGSVYALVDEKTNIPFYVGSTVFDVEHRFNQHQSGRTSRKVVEYLKNNNTTMRPILLKEVEYGTTLELRKVEEQWVKKLSSKGYSLVNIQYNRPKAVSVQVNWDVYIEVCEYLMKKKQEGVVISIGEFFTQAAEEHLQRLQKQKS